MAPPTSASGVSARESHRRLRERRIVAVLRAATSRDALDVASLLIDAGISAVEVAFTTPDATLVIKTLSRSHGAALVLGAGTITTAEQAAAAARAGAEFLVAPGCPPELVEDMRATGRLVIPGALTPTEVMSAVASGSNLVKLFPAAAVGPDYLRSLRAPFPDVDFMPTGGVTATNVEDWFSAGAVVVGIGGALAPARAPDARSRAAVRRGVVELLDMLNLSP